MAGPVSKILSKIGAQGGIREISRRHFLAATTLVAASTFIGCRDEGAKPSFYTMPSVRLTPETVHDFVRDLERHPVLGPREVRKISFESHPLFWGMNFESYIEGYVNYHSTGAVYDVAILQNTRTGILQTGVRELNNPRHEWLNAGTILNLAPIHAGELIRPKVITVDDYPTADFGTTCGGGPPISYVVRRNCDAVLSEWFSVDYAALPDTIPELAPLRRGFQVLGACNLALREAYGKTGGLDAARTDLLHMVSLHESAHQRLGDLLPSGGLYIDGNIETEGATGRGWFRQGEELLCELGIMEVLLRQPPSEVNERQILMIVQRHLPFLILPPRDRSLMVDAWDLPAAILLGRAQKREGGGWTWNEPARMELLALTRSLAAFVVEERKKFETEVIEPRIKNYLASKDVGGEIQELAKRRSISFVQAAGEFWRALEFQIVHEGKNPGYFDPVIREMSNAERCVRFQENLLRRIGFAETSFPTFIAAFYSRLGY